MKGLLSSLKDVFKKETWKLDNKENIKHKLPHLLYFIPIGLFIYFGHTTTSESSSVVGQFIVIIPLIGFIAIFFTIIYILFPTNDTIDSSIEDTIETLIEQKRLIYMSDNELEFTNKTGFKRTITIQEMAELLFNAGIAKFGYPGNVTILDVQNMIIKAKEK